MKVAHSLKILPYRAKSCCEMSSQTGGIGDHILHVRKGRQDHRPRKWIGKIFI